MITVGTTFRTPSEGKVEVRGLKDGGVILHLSGIRKHSAWFDCSDIQALREFLDELQEHIESAGL